MKGPFLKIEKFNGHEQIFQVTWPKTWGEQTFHVPAQDLTKTDFFQVTWPRLRKSKLSMYLAQDLAKANFFPSDMA